MKYLFNLLIVVAASLITGCATFDSIERVLRDTTMSMFESMGCTMEYRRGQGHAQVFDAPFEEVWNALPRVMISLGFSEDFPIRSYSDGLANGRGRLRADRPPNKFRGPDGPPVFIFVDREGESRTRVEAISKFKCHMGSLFLHDWGPEVMQKTEQILLQEKQKKPQQLILPPMEGQQ